MIGVYIYVGILVLGVIVVTIWLINKMLVPVIRLQKFGAGERTKFVINTSDKKYEYYEKFIENWLNNNNFSKYNKRINGRWLKYHVQGNIFMLGFNYYKDNKNIIIEAWLSVLGKENPLSTKVYKHEKGEINLVSGITGNSFISDDKTETLVNQQGKDEYLKLLNSVINVPNVVEGTNNVTLKNNFDMSDIPNQKNQKKFTFKLIFAILGISIFITALLYLPTYINNININKKATVEDLLRAEEYLKSNYQIKTIESKDKSVTKLSGGDFYVTYSFVVILKTPESDNDKVLISMSNSENSPYYSTPEDIEWSITIQQIKANNGKKWNYSFIEQKM